MSVKDERKNYMFGMQKPLELYDLPDNFYVTTGLFSNKRCCGPAGTLYT